MSRVLGGAVLVILGIAAFIEASSHEPEYTCTPRGELGQNAPGNTFEQVT